MIPSVRWQVAQSMPAVWWLSWQARQVATGASGSSVTRVTWHSVQARSACRPCSKLTGRSCGARLGTVTSTLTDRAGSISSALWQVVQSDFVGRW